MSLHITYSDTDTDTHTFTWQDCWEIHLTASHNGQQVKYVKTPSQYM